MKKKSILFTTVLFLFACTSIFAQDTARLSVTPQLVEIGTFFDGASLIATGTVPAASHVVVRFLGSSCDLHMKQKGKLFGIMWMNLDSLIFRGVPNVCIVSSAKDFDSLAEANEGSAINSLRLAGIKDNARIESNGSDQTKAFAELIKLKSLEGLYRRPAATSPTVRLITVKRASGHRFPYLPACRRVII
jgi:hypothetical protein